MRRFRAPRYAPESLERKLHPSGIAPIALAADVFVPTAATTSTAPAASAGAVAARDVPPPDGTDPAPPDGDGTPPKDSPTTPVGPGEPGYSAP